MAHEQACSWALSWLLLWELDRVLQQQGTMVPMCPPQPARKEAFLIQRFPHLGHLPPLLEIKRAYQQASYMALTTVFCLIFDCHWALNITVWKLHVSFLTVTAATVVFLQMTRYFASKGLGPGSPVLLCRGGQISDLLQSWAANGDRTPALTFPLPGVAYPLYCLSGEVKKVENKWNHSLVTHLIKLPSSGTIV